MPVDPAPQHPADAPSGGAAPGLDRAAVLAALRTRLARLGPAGERPEPGAIPLCPEMDRALPGGGLARAALHEILSDDAGAAAGFAALLAARSGGAVFWVACGPDAAPPNPVRFGLPPSRLVVVRPAGAEDALWAAEEALGCRAATAVVLAGRAEEGALSRLRLAASTGGGIGLLLCGEDAGEGPSPAATRWRVTGRAGGTARDLGDPQWTLDLLAVGGRAGRAQGWRVTWRAGLESLVVEEPPAPEAPHRRARRA